MLDSGRPRRHARIAFGAAFALLLFAVAFVYRYGADSPESPGSLVWSVFWLVTIVGLLALLVWGGMNAHDAGHFARLERGEGVLARWTVDAETWRGLAEERARLERGTRQSSPATRQESPPSGIEVVVCEDAVYIGRDEWSPMFAAVGIRATLQGSWLILEWATDESDSLVRVPVAPTAHADAERVARHFNSAYEARVKEAVEARAKDTSANRLLTWIEGHFVLFVLLFFFVLIPAFVGLVYLLTELFSAPQ